MAEIGDRIDVWVVEARLGRGGTAEVYRCHNKDAARILAAVKLLDPAVRKYPDAKARFIREAEILFGLDHPNIVKVRNVRFDVDQPYLEMEWVSGPSLEAVLREGPLPYETALSRMHELLLALTYLHDKGIRHRDIKPANIILANTGNLVLVDFGLAVELAGERITSSEAMFGTVSYAPPEWVSPSELDPRLWDLYSCGIVFYEMLTGKVAFPVPRDASTRRQALRVMTEKSAVEHVDPGEGHPEAARQLVRELTARDPKDRPKSAREVLDRLASMGPREAGVPVGQRHEPRQPPGETIVAPDSSAPSSGGFERVEVDTWNQADLATPTAAIRRESTADQGTPTAALPRGGVPDSEAPAGRSMVGLVALVALLGLGGLGLAAAAVGWMAVQPPAERAVDLVVAGAPDPSLVVLRLDGRAAGTREGFTHRFGAVAPGPVQVAWAVGPGCDIDDCPGSSCPTWCATGTVEAVVEAGEGVLTLPVEVAPAAPGSLSLRAPALADDAVVRWTVGERAVEGAGSVELTGVLPGPYEVLAEIGTCAAADRGCVSGECPDACRSWVGSVELAAGADVLAVEAALTPLPAAAPAPRPSGRAGAPVGAAEFARWLGDHPEWSRDAAIAAGKADSNYLRRFDPSAGVAGSMTGVSWAAASAFCSGRGGLAALSAQPHAWAESSDQPFQEWRSDGGQPAWRRFDGATSLAAKAAESNAFTGFRCAR